MMNENRKYHENALNYATKNSFKPKFEAIPTSLPSSTFIYEAFNCVWCKTKWNLKYLSIPVF